MKEWMNDQMHELMNEWRNKQTNEWSTNERKNEYMNEFGHQLIPVHVRITMQPLDCGTGFVIIRRMIVFHLSPLIQVEELLVTHGGVSLSNG